MSRRIQSYFESYELTEEEQRIACQLTSLQKQYIHNIRVNIAMEKLSLTFTPDNLGRDAELQGQLGILNMLLQASEEASPPLINISTASPSNQSNQSQE